MTMLTVILSCILSFASAQQIQIKEDMNDKELTTIEVRKKHSVGHDLTYKIEEGKDEIEGDAAPLLQNARKNWKQSCNDWKKEFRENNVGNKIISTNCGKMKCETVAMETVCRSETTYKVRVKLTSDSATE
ncbi:MAG: hypothetical protein V4736_11200 [Bdellovibrionota bacterium]